MENQQEQSDFQQLQAELDIHFQNVDLLRHAFTHSSYVNEHRLGTLMSNERLEFLGDAVLELTISEFLYREFPEQPEGDLTKTRANIVCESAFAGFATDLNFGEYLLLGNGEEQMGGRTRAALLADVFEAFVAALYLDQGIEAVVSFLEKVVFPKVKDGSFSRLTDYKSELQEVLQKNGSCRIVYQTISETGPAHEKVFEAAVEANGVEYGRGTGKTKKEAEQDAASIALAKLRE